jgi:hypothetical protein
VFAAGVEALFGEPFLLMLAEEEADKKGNNNRGPGAPSPSMGLTAEQRLQALEAFEGAFFDFEAGFEVRPGGSGKGGVCCIRGGCACTSKPWPKFVADNMQTGCESWCLHVSRVVIHTRLMHV